MLMGYKVKLPAPVQSIFASSAAFTESEHVSRVQDNLHLFDEKAFAAIKKQFQKNLQRFEKRRERSLSRKAGDLAIGDFVLELSDTAGPLTRGPYRIIGFKKYGAIAVLMTGATEFKQRQQYDRHTSRLARYYE